MKLLFLALSILTALAAPLPRVAPEGAGVSSGAILKVVDALDAIEEMHSVMIVRDGKVICEGFWTPYNAETPHELFSLSKSFTSTAVGIAVAEGKLSIDDPVISFFGDKVPADASANLKAMRVRDLLCMSAGHDKEAPVFGDGLTTDAFLKHPVAFKPGTHFLYNTPATFMASAIVQKVTGQTVNDYLQTRLYDPLGIEAPRWDKNSEGISLGGYGLFLKTEDIAKFGTLYLRKGLWSGKQILTEEWVDLATSKQTSNGSNPNSDWEQGYGFQFWRSRNGAYRGDGAFGQYCVVMPNQRTVVAITSGVRDMQAVLNVLWDKLLPALPASRGVAVAGLPENAEANDRLKARLKGLTIRHPQGAKTSNVAKKTYRFENNDAKLEALTISGNELTVMVDGKEQRIEFGAGEWKKSRVKFGMPTERPVGISGAWPSADTLALKVCYYDSPFVANYTLKFAEDAVTVDREMNVAFGPRKGPTLKGAAAGRP